MNKHETVLTDDEIATIKEHTIQAYKRRPGLDYEHFFARAIEQAVLSKPSQQPKDVQGAEPIAWRFKNSVHGWSNWCTDKMDHDRFKADGASIEYAYSHPPTDQLSAAREEGRRHGLEKNHRDFGNDQISYAEEYASTFDGQLLNRIDLVNAVYWGMRYIHPHTDTALLEAAYFEITRLARLANDAHGENAVAVKLRSAIEQTRGWG